jgi:hypothetical protein
MQKAEAAAKIPIDTSDLANASKADLKIIQGIHDVAEDAETDAFNPALDKASGDAKTALQVRDRVFFTYTSNIEADINCRIVR